MALAAGTRLGPYEILAPLGAGGMGEVYQARDTRLDRTVAIKVLPAELSTDPERAARFEREARTIAALNHPHICTLHDIGQHDGATYLVMEHLVGETLAQRLRTGPLPVPQALEIGAQIAEALDAAHKAGIVHRDLKPGNVMLTAGGVGRSGTGPVKLLDFGLAKLLDPQVSGRADVSAPTATEPLTQAGEVLGTRPYMAPEQVEGKATDARTDLWALGCVLYEMVTGRAAFGGETVASITAAILERDPEPLASQQPLTPPALDHVVRKCLAKQPDQRWDSAHDVAEELRWVHDTRVEPTLPSRPLPTRSPRWTTTLALVCAAGVAGAVLASLVRSPQTSPTRFPLRSQVSVAPAEDVYAHGDVEKWTPTPGGARTALSWTPDGRNLLFVGYRGSWNHRQLWRRALAEDQASPLAGTEGASCPVLSPDGRWVAFWAHGAIRKVPVTGGPSAVIADGPTSAPMGMAWGDDGTLVFAGGLDHGLWQVPADGGVARVVVRPNGSEQRYVLPHFLPGGTVVTYTVRKGSSIWVGDRIVARVMATGDTRTLLEDGVDARYLPTGHLVFLRFGTLFAVGFDLNTLAVQGAPVAVMDGVAQAIRGESSEDVSGAGQFSVSSTGTLAYIGSPITPPSEQALVSVDLHGVVTRLAAPVKDYAGAVRVSPDGSRLAVPVRDLKEQSLWIFDLQRGTLTKVLSGETNNPEWTADGRAVVSLWSDGTWRGLVRVALDGTAPTRLAAEKVQPAVWLPDGRGLLMLKPDEDDIWLASFDGGEVQVTRFLGEAGTHERAPAFSPDGQWLAFQSDVSGQDEVYLKPYPGPGSSVQVSINGGANPLWGPTGQRLFFVLRGPLSGPGTMMAADLRFAPSLSVGQPFAVFEFPGDVGLVGCRPTTWCFSLAPDGRHFYTTQFLSYAKRPSVTHFNLVQNWVEELKAKVPSGTR